MGKLVLVGSSLTMCMIGTGAAAHVNWFVESDAEPLANFNISDPIFLSWLFLASMMVLFSVWLDGKLPTLRIVDTKLRHDFMEILRVFTGMSFLLTAYEGSLVAPHKVAEGSFGLFLVVMQAIIGIMLIANRWIKIAAVLMLVLHAGVAVKFGLFPALEYAIIIGIAFFLLLNSIEDEARRDLLKPYSVDALRIWTGISLVALAIGEKLAPSALGQVFVAQYQWNFMQALGFTFFDDRLFVSVRGNGRSCDRYRFDPWHNGPPCCVGLVRHDGDIERRLHHPRQQRSSARRIYRTYADYWRGSSSTAAGVWPKTENHGCLFVAAGCQLSSVADAPAANAMNSNQSPKPNQRTM